jgi:hypothetical protein
MTLYSIKAPNGPPSLAEAATLLQIVPSDLDDHFGVVLIDPAQHLYTVNTRTDQNNLAGHTSGTAGPYANPRIEGFGPSNKI